MAYSNSPQFPWPIPPGRTLRCALTLLALSALLQILAAAWGLQRRQSFRALLPFSNANSISNTPATELTPPGILDPHSLVTLQPRLLSPSLREPWEEALETARTAAALRQTDAALKALLEAEASVPERPSALAELALQYEKVGHPKQAIKLWEKVRKLGPSGGVFHDAASAKLSLLTEHATDSLRLSLTPPVPKPGLLKFGNFTVTNADSNTPENRKFAMRVPVTRAEGAHINASGVFLQVQFYDQINDGPIERTNASVSWTWARNPIDWATSRTQTLQVGYTQAPQRSASEKRRFFGYVASVYYEGKLLDTRSNPARLGHQYPPPRMLSRDSAQ
jgi:hypothetical protein